MSKNKFLQNVSVENLAKLTVSLLEKPELSPTELELAQFLSEEMDNN